MIMLLYLITYDIFPPARAQLDTPRYTLFALSTAN